MPATRAAILDAAGKEVLQNGYAGSSLSSIASRLVLTKGALTRQFPSKESLVWATLETLRESIERERSRAMEAYPASGVRAAIHFLLTMGRRSASEPQVAAAVVLLTDRASPAFGTVDIYEVWAKSLEELFDLASERGEIDSSACPADLAKFMFVANMGDAVFVGHSVSGSVRPDKLSLIRFMFAAAGVVGTDDIIDQVLAAQTGASTTS